MYDCALGACAAATRDTQQCFSVYLQSKSYSWIFFLTLLDPKRLVFCLHLPYQRNFVTEKLRLARPANVTYNVRKVNHFNIWKIKLRATRAPQPMIYWISYSRYTGFSLFLLIPFWNVLHFLFIQSHFSDIKQALKKCLFLYILTFKI